MKLKQQIQYYLDPALRYIDSDLSVFKPLVEEINHLHAQLQRLEGKQLQERAKALLKRGSAGFDADALLVEAYALAMEACIRQLGLRPFEEQIIAAIAMHQGKLIEMQTGEGKTLAAVFPAYLNALSGKGVHVLTFNDYLARRDAQWMGPVYSFLGLSVGYINEGMEAEKKKKAYQQSLTYVTAKAVGFDYLRSFHAYEPEEVLLRPFHYAIVDEADALLIDEARNPLVLAGKAGEPSVGLYEIARFVEGLEKDIDFEIDEVARTIFLSAVGAHKAEQLFRAGNLHSDENLELHTAIILALQARVLLRKDADYIVKEGAVKLVDEFTGRVVEDRKWRSGLQAAVEAREGLPVQSEGIILNAITVQHLLRQYPKMAGMTATARPAAEEFFNFYGLRTVVIPPHLPCQRTDHPDVIFATCEAKIHAIVEEIKRVHQSGRPILAGTRTVRESEELAGRLHEQGVPCQILNAKNDEREAAIIAEAGRIGAVTISTNMAGRGTDIVLGGKNGSEKEAVAKLGGLYVIGTNRHESARIDQQLRGRAGRQGDVGNSRFFISMEDSLMEKYKLKEVLPQKYRKLEGDEPVQAPKVREFINIMQRIIENRFFDMRKQLYEYATFMEIQRAILQEERQQLLFAQPGIEAPSGRILNLWNKYQELEGELRQHMKTLFLFEFDKYWAAHLDQLWALRENIHLVQLGGQNPLREFRKKADVYFQSLQQGLEQELQEKAAILARNGNLTGLGVSRPSATWSYVLNETPFSNQLALMLMDNSNIGLQVDFVSAFLLFFLSLFRRLKRKRQGE